MKTNHMPSLEVIEKVVEGRGLACPGCGHERLQSKQHPGSGYSDDRAARVGLQEVHRRHHRRCLHSQGCAGSWQCRASKAVIKEIIGDLCGEQVGISKYDLRTLYYAGDEVEIDNFDFSNEECSTGFHFFCTIEEARRY